MEKKEITYAAAIAEIEGILEKLNGDELDVDALSSQVKRATELISFCREKLRKTEEDVAKVLKDE